MGGRGSGGSGGTRGGGRAGKNTLDGVEASIRNNSYESAAIFDANGNLLLRKTGGDHEVKFSRAETALLKDSVLTHNHPEMDALSVFSKADINMTTKHDLKEMRAVTRDTTYTLTKVENKRSKSKFAEDYEDAMRREGQRLSLSITSNKILSQRLSSFCSNWLKNNSSKYGYVYKESRI